ncbi:hypothetical protein [Microcoleus sp. B13-B6]|uniref:hypothetical protein n=2 Tax=unclassified Microcoleus TaxID=2642155 RepID=UPI002FCF48AA
MTPLTEKHAQLLKSNRALLLTFERLPIAGKLSAVALALILGVYSGITAIQGTASNRVQLCIRNKSALQCVDKAGKPYIMTEYHAEKWKANPNVVFHKRIPATNPHKALWMALAGSSFWVAGIGFRSLQNSERQLANYEAIAEKCDLAKGQLNARTELLEDWRIMRIKEVQTEGDLEAVANDCAVVLKQCEVLGEADIRIAQMEAEEAVFDAETAGLSDEKKQEYIAFLRNQKTPFQLTGTQTLDGINNPSDKVESGSASAIESATVSHLLHPSETKAIAILKQVAGSRLSLLLIAGSGGGKTVTQACLISLLLEKCPDTEFWVVSQKNDSYCGLREKGRVTLFEITNLKATLDRIHHVWEIYDTRRRKKEHERASMSPVRLLLADWLSINSALQEMASHPDVKASNYLVELCDIGLNGRDFNVGFWADLQSFYLLAIGMKADSNIRQNFNLIGLGNYYTDEFGFVNDSYGVLANMIATHSIIENKEVRQALLVEFNDLKPISKQHERPIMLSTLEPPTVCLQADVRHYQQQHQIVSGVEASSGQADTSDSSFGKDDAPASQDWGNLQNPYGKGEKGSEGSETSEGVEASERSLEDYLADVLTETSAPVFSEEFPLTDHQERVQLARLLIAKKLGKQKTIWLLWGLKDGGRNNHRYIDARTMLENLMKGEGNDNAQ